MVMARKEARALPNLPKGAALALCLLAFVLQPSTTLGASPFMISQDADSRPTGEIIRERTAIDTSIHGVELRTFDHKSGTYGSWLKMSGRALSWVETDKVISNPAQVVRAVLREYRDATRYDDAMELTTPSVAEWDNGRIYLRFQQLIDGAPVEAQNRILIDGPTGELLSIRTFLVDAAILETRKPLISRREAHNLALDELALIVGQEELIRSDERSTNVDDTELLYVHTGQPDHGVEPYWILRVAFIPLDDKVFSGPYLFRVNARTGAAKNYTQFLDCWGN